MEQSIVAGIMGVVDDVLCRHHIQIPDDHRGQSQKAIVGAAYYEMYDALTKYLNSPDKKTSEGNDKQNRIAPVTDLADARPFYLKAPMAAALACNQKSLHHVPAVWRIKGRYARWVGVPSDAIYQGNINDDFVWITQKGNRIDIKKLYSVGDLFYLRESVTPVVALLNVYRNGVVVDVEDHYGWQYDDGELLFSDGFKPRNDEFHLTEIKPVGKRKTPTEMPKAAARRVICINEVQIKHLHDVTEEEIVRAGVPTEQPMHRMFCRRCGGTGMRKESPCGACKTLFQRYENFWNNALSTTERDALSILTWKWNPWVIALGFDVYRRFYTTDAHGNGVPDMITMELEE